MEYGDPWKKFRRTELGKAWSSSQPAWTLLAWRRGEHLGVFVHTPRANNTNRLLPQKDILTYAPIILVGNKASQGYEQGVYLLRTLLNNGCLRSQNTLWSSHFLVLLFLSAGLGLRDTGIGHPSE